MQQRADECTRALDKLFEINGGVAVDNVLKSQFDWTTLEVGPPLGRHADLITVAMVIADLTFTARGDAVTFTSSLSPLQLLFNDCSKPGSPNSLH